MCTVNTGIITKVKLASPRAFLTVEELFTFHISPRPTSSRLSKQTERVSGALKINGRTFIKQQKVLKSRFGRAFIEARPPLGLTPGDKDSSQFLVVLIKTSGAGAGDWMLLLDAESLN